MKHTWFSDVLLVLIPNVLFVIIQASRLENFGENVYSSNSEFRRSKLSVGNQQSRSRVSARRESRSSLTTLVSDNHISVPDVEYIDEKNPARSKIFEILDRRHRILDSNSEGTEIKETTEKLSYPVSSTRFKNGNISGSCDVASSNFSNQNTECWVPESAKEPGYCVVLNVRYRPLRSNHYVAGQSLDVTGRSADLQPSIKECRSLDCFSAIQMVTQIATPARSKDT